MMLLIQKAIFSMLQIPRKSAVVLFFPPLFNSDGLSCLLCKCCQKVFSAGSHKQKYTTWSQRLHPCACLKVEKKKKPTKNLCLSVA